QSLAKLYTNSNVRNLFCPYVLRMRVNIISLQCFAKVWKDHPGSSRNFVRSTSMSATKAAHSRVSVFPFSCILTSVGHRSGHVTTVHNNTNPTPLMTWWSCHSYSRWLLFPMAEKL